MDPHVPAKPIQQQSLKEFLKQVPLRIKGLFVLFGLVIIGFIFLNHPQAQQHSKKKLTPTPTVLPVIDQTDTFHQLFDNLPPVIGSDSWSEVKRDTYPYTTSNTAGTSTSYISGFSIESAHDATAIDTLLSALVSYKGPKEFPFAQWQKIDQSADQESKFTHQVNYIKNEGDKQQLLVFRYNASTIQADPQAQPTCPCSYDYYIFYSDPFPTQLPTGTLMGTIRYGPTDPLRTLCGAPADNIQILFTASNGSIYITTTNDQGQYTMSLSPDIYTISYVQHDIPYRDSDILSNVLVKINQVTTFNGCFDTEIR